jgi:hypothetical protein
MCFSPKQRSVTRIGPWFVIIKIALKKTKCTLAGAVSVDAQIELGMQADVRSDIQTDRFDF